MAAIKMLDSWDEPSIQLALPSIIFLVAVSYTIRAISGARQNRFNDLTSGSSLITTDQISDGSSTRKDDRPPSSRSVVNSDASNRNELASYKGKSTADKLRSLLEAVIVIFLGTTQLLFCLTLDVDDTTLELNAAIVGCLLWAFLFVLVLLRMSSDNQSVRWFGTKRFELWRISFVCYAVMLFNAAVLFCISVVGSIDDKARVSFIKRQFYAGLLLCVLMSTFQIDQEDHTLNNPPPSYSFLSLITFHWVQAIILKARKCFLKDSDIWDLHSQDQSVSVIRAFEQSTEREIGVYEKLKRYLRGLFVAHIFLAMATSTMNFMPTLFMQQLLQFMSSEEKETSGYMWVFVFLTLAGSFGSAVCHNYAQFIGERGSIHLRSILISEIYSKTLKVKRVEGKPKSEDASEGSSDSDKSDSPQQSSVINLMSVDVFKVSEICPLIYAAMEAILMTIIAVVLLYRLLGWSSIVGSLTLLTFLPLSFALAGLYGKLQMQGMSLTDQRTTSISENIQAMKIIKAFSWEELFLKKIDAIREGELKILKGEAAVISLSHFVWFMTPTIVSLVTFAIYIYVQKCQLTASVAFTAIALFAILKSPLNQIANTLTCLAQCKVFLDRIANYLGEPESKKYENLTVNADRFGFDDAYLSWEEKPGAFKLRNISIDFKLKGLNVITGATGSGKTSLLLGLLGELELDSGSIFVPCLGPRCDLKVGIDGLTDSIAYCPQTPWLLNDTVRDNILFGRDLDEQRYKTVISACSLEPDLEILPHGDQTRVGDRGITLSGGQQQRISIARALYSTSRHLVLDDCLSAVDPDTASHLYDNALCGPLMQGRTCILASHNVALTTKLADWVVILNDGTVKAQGPPSKLASSGFLLHDMSDDSDRQFSKDKAEQPKIPDVSEETNAVEDSNKGNDLTREDYEEGKMEGTVDLSVYKWYARYMGGWNRVCWFTLLTFIVHAICLSQGFWLRIWVLDIPPNENPGTPSDTPQDRSHSDMYFLLYYFLIGLVYAIVATGKMQVAFMVGISAARKIFKTLLTAITYAKTRFLDTTPSGRITNRFSKDMDVVDQQIVRFFEGFAYCLVSSTLTLLLVTVVQPRFLFFAVPISTLYVISSSLYLSASRELKRIDSVNVSPIHQFFAETLRGGASIRAFGDESRFSTQNLKNIDHSNGPFYYLCATNEWIAFRLNILSGLVMFGAAVLVLINASHLDAGLAGIVLSNALAFSEGAQWLVQMYAGVELGMSSVERIKEYTEVEGESVDKNEGLVSNEWPEAGKIEVADLSLRYSPELPQVLKRVTFNVEPGSKVAIVGRTGAGKSSLMAAFYRFVEADGGSIVIDGVDISTVSLNKLRRSITSIPQNPVLFKGTIRSNLDPSDLYTDEQLYESLLQVNLLERKDLPKTAANGIPFPVIPLESENVNVFVDLNSTVSEGGSNFSVGQRQLLCLARSLLRCQKIMLIDEATASIDYECDAKIQETIRHNLSDVTVLTIAHRLRSIIDYDKVIVMEKGEVKECDEPHLLLEDKESIFYQICRNSDELEDLLILAKKSYESRNPQLI